MTLEELKKAILALSPQDQLRLLQEVGPQLCASVMGNSDAMAQMRPQCREMMSRYPKMMARLRQMMSRVSL